MRASPALAALACLALLALLPLLPLEPRLAHASACCGAGHGIGQRLNDTEDAALSTAVGGAIRLGSWTHERSFIPPGEGDLDGELRAEIGWLVRVKRRAQVGLSVPLIYTLRQAGDLSSSGGGVGDITALARVDLLTPTAIRWAPGVALTLVALVPTGRGASRSTDLLAADATGLGTAEIRPGIALEKTWIEGWFAMAQLAVGLRIPYIAPSGLAIGLAPRWQALAAAGPSWSSGFSLSLGLLYEREAAPSLGGVTAPDAARERTAALLFAAYDIDMRYTVFISSRVDAPIPGLGRNEGALAAASIGLRRAWGMVD
jgi:hypothetical protein